MKTKIFDKKLFIEGINQLKGPAIICTIILSMASIICPILQAYESNIYLDNFIETNYFLPIVIYIFAPVFTFYLFRFLFKRKSSDFYHSISAKRITLYVSFSASIIFCLTAIILICSALMILFSVILSIQMNLFTILPTILNMIAGSALMTSGILIGSSLSGKFISAFTASGIILFYPRLLLFFIIETFKETITIVDSKYFDLPLGNRLNTLTGAFINGYTKYSSALYSIILALIYFIIGAALFNKRKSEFAGKTSLSKFMQTLFRVAFCIIFCIPAAMIIFEDYYRNYDMPYSYSFTIVPIVILYFLAVVAYFLFEIITKRSLKTMPRAICEFGYVILLNILIIGGMSTAKCYIESYRPDADKIDSIRVMANSDTYESYYYEEIVSENEALRDAEKVDITDKEIIKLISDEYNNSIENNIIKSPLYADNIDYDNKFNIAFKTGMSTKHRVLYLKENTYEKICDKLCEYDKFYSALSYLPDNVKEIKIFNYDTGIYDVTITNENSIETIYQHLKSEMSKINPSDLISNNYYYSFDNLFNLYLTDNNSKHYVFPINENMINTYNDCYEYIYNEKVNKDNIKKLIKVLKSKEYKEQVKINRSTYDYEDEEYEDFDSYFDLGFETFETNSTELTVKPGLEIELANYLEKQNLSYFKNCIKINANYTFYDEENLSNLPDVDFSATLCFDKAAYKKFFE